MPEYLKALVVILVLATVVFASAKASACALGSIADDFERRRNLWFGITLAAFLAQNFWIYMIVAAALLLSALPREANKLAMFFFILFAAPPIGGQITGLGIINHFFTINYPRLLALTVLLPAFLYLRTQPGVKRFGQSLPDKFIAGYIVLQFALMMSVNTFTNTLREGVFYQFIDIVLPYYVASRLPKNLQGFRDTLMAFVMAALVLGAIGVFEFSRHWLLYVPLQDALGVSEKAGGYSVRGDSVRALGSTRQPIPFGYVMVVAMGFSLYLRKLASNRMNWGLGFVLLTAGLIASLSRGPWVGAAVLLLVFVAIGPTPARHVRNIGLLGVIILPVLLGTPWGEKLIDFLPFIGKVGGENVDYRQRLVEISIQIILQNPFFGSYDFLYSEAMQEMKQGEGIIDIVNTYLAIGMSSGLVGLGLFSGAFIAAALGVFKAMRNQTDRNGEFYLLGQVLLSTLFGIMVIIGTVSSVSIIPVIYWSVVGLCVAYARMLATAKVPAKEPEAAKPSRFQPVAIKTNRKLTLPFTKFRGTGRIGHTQ